MLDLTKKYDMQLRDMRAAIGFMLGFAGLQRDQVPKNLV